MQLGDIPGDIQPLVLDFFQRFSRFEFALKEAGHLKDRTPGRAAEPGWDVFVSAYEKNYAPTAAAKALAAANPKKQVVGTNGQSLEFHDLTFPPGTSELAKTVRYMKTVRNNLFHGGKHDAAGWDDPMRISELIPFAATVLNELAGLDHRVEADYPGAY